ncbi:MAG: tRNA (guanosine(46)-N7)-methyltransferase TrmB [Ruminococcaceae bacterium]|nr:tRNA (guanosine(46)-N7)-methyltransferase TrmB [Oscillospiraceae bacterium]
MRMRKKKWAEPELNACDFFIQNPCDYKNNWKDFFKNENPLELEVGCGKGNFVSNKGLLNPDVNFLAVDLISNMLAVARRNIVKLFSENNRECKNIALTSYNVDKISEIVGKADGIGKIYINFCNPWPRLKHNKRRLTHPTKLNQYKEILAEDGEIHFKTDSDLLFDDSLEYFKECGFEITYLTRDLHRSDVKGNIVTEHEKMFSDEGIPIKFLIAKK